MKKTPLLALLAMLALAGCSREPRTVPELTTAGDRAYFAGKYADARANYLKGLAIKPSDKHLLYFTGLSYSRETKFDSALIYLKRADLLYPNDHEINSELLPVARELKEWKYAIGAIKSLIATGEAEPQFWPLLAEFYVKTQQPAQAYYYQHKLVDAGTNDPEAYMRLINTALAVDSLKVAKAYLDSATTKFGQRPEFTANAAFIAVYQKDYDQAEPLFRQALSADSSVVGYKVGLANVLSFSNDKEKLRESLSLYRQIRDVTGDQFHADSMINLLEQAVR